MITFLYKIIVWWEKRKALNIFGAVRNSKWPRIRAAYLKLHPQCEVCGSKEFLQVHHIQPFHLKPELELDFNNLIVLCETPNKNCHFQFGHLYSWRSFNTKVAKDVIIWRNKIIRRP